MPNAPWLHAADITGNFTAGADLALAIQQGKMKKEQLKAMADYHAEQIDNQISRLQEATAHHRELEDNAAQLTDIRQQLATAQQNSMAAKTAREKIQWDDKVDHWNKQLAEKTREANQTADVSEDRIGMEGDARGAALKASLQLGDQKAAIARDTASMRNDTANFQNIFNTLQRDNVGKEKDKQQSPDALADQAGDIWDTIKQKRAKAALMNPPGASPASGTPAPQAQPQASPAATAAPVVAPNGGKVKVKSPNGKIGLIPAAQLKDAQAQGFVPIQ
jgi:hypothetical protein